MKRKPAIVTVQFDMSGESSLLRKAYGLDEVPLSDFKVTHLLGQGAFGRVFLSTLDSTEKRYAIKVMRKDRLVESRNSIKSVMIEF